jgi:DNA-binding CsgD family transcriptional regulator
MYTIDQLNKTYAAILKRQKFVGSELDYSILEQHKILLQKLAKLGNSGITVFDLYQEKHVFSSYNMGMLFGYDLNLIEEGGNAYFNTRIHPNDYVVLTQNGILLFNFVFALPITERMDYKLINEYRILNSDDNYVRVIEQHQALELDNHGNVWLALSVMDISPNQDEYQGVKYQLLNYKKGKFVSSFPESQQSSISGLTKREKEILKLIRDGLLSKEISDKLFISIYTVNTHRQHILEKLGADNSIEAVNYASQLGLLK